MTTLTLEPYQIKAFEHWRDDPIAFQVDCLDVQKAHVWDKMAEVAYSVRDNELTAVKAGHSVSKSYEAARLALWFLACHPPATVITTAPTHNQVENVLWREIRDAHVNAKIPIGGRLTTTKLDLGEKWFALGFATRPDTITQQATAFQGFHNDNVLIVFDEAAGILPQIWQAAETLMTSGHCRMLAIGNPTSAFGKFPDCFEPDSEWNQITISVLDTPNYKQHKEVIPGLAGRKFEAKVRRDYGADSNYYRSRVLGEIPEVVEGAIYGKEVITARRENRICKVNHDTAGSVHTAWDLGIGDSTAIWFFQLIGQEIHVIDYYETCGENLAHYAKMLDNKRADLGYIYGEHYGPHDLRKRELGTGLTLYDTAWNLGIQFDVLERAVLEGGIELARQVFPRCWFDRDRCREGLKSLAEYHWRKIERLSTEERIAWANVPEHDPSSHGADSFRYMATAIQEGVTATVDMTKRHRIVDQYREGRQESVMSV